MPDETPEAPKSEDAAWIAAGSFALWSAAVDVLATRRERARLLLKLAAICEDWERPGRAPALQHASRRMLRRAAETLRPDRPAR